MDNEADLSQPLSGNTAMNLIPTIGIAYRLAAASGLALADNSRAPMTRAEVKAETRALLSEHKLAPAGRDGINNPLAKPSRDRRRRSRSAKPRSPRRATTASSSLPATLATSRPIAPPGRRRRPRYETSAGPKLGPPKWAGGLPVRAKQGTRQGTSGERPPDGRARSGHSLPLTAVVHG
jgi:hypothetical protein